MFKPFVESMTFVAAVVESIASNEAFGNIYLYRLLLREAVQQAI